MIQPPKSGVTISIQPEDGATNSIPPKDGATGKRRAAKFKLSIALFWSFLQIGAFTIGGGYAMLPLIQKEVIDKRKWMESDDFLDGLALSQSLPGPIAVNIAAHVGYRLTGFQGALAAVLGAVLPSFLTILLISMFVYQFHEQPLWNRIFQGIRPAVVALIAASLIKLGQMSKLTWKTAWLPVVVFICIAFFNVSPILMIILACIVGILLLGKAR